MNIKRSIVTVEPVVEPVFVEDIAKVHLKVDGTTDDYLLNIWIQAAREMVEERTGRSLITQTRKIELDYFPQCYSIELLYGPVQSIVITYYDSNNALQTLSSSEYYLHNDKVVVKNYWPATYDRPGAVILTYVAGYGDSATDIPYQLRSAVLLRLGHLYEHRESIAIGTAANEVPLGEDDLIRPYIRVQDAFY